MTNKEFDERLDEILFELQRTAFISDTKLLSAREEAKQSLRQLFKDVVGEDRKEDDTNCAWGHDFAASIINERNAELREKVEGEKR